MKKVIVFIISVFSLAAFSEVIKFRHIKVKQKLLEKYYQGNKNPMAMEGGSEVYLLDDSDLNKGEDRKVDDDFFDKLKKKLKEEMLNALNHYTKDLIQFSEEFELGESNFSGFEWTHFSAEFELKAGREVYPESSSRSNSKRWIVEDNFQVTIDARTFLEYLTSLDLIEISPANIKLFAGIAFRRSFKYIHYADSYLKGLKSDPEKLFFAYKLFRPGQFLGLESKEAVTKRDYLSRRIGASTRIPIYANLTIRPRLIQYWDKLSKVTMQRSTENDELLKVSVSREKMKNFQGDIELRGEFLELLRLTLFSVETRFGKGKEFVVHLKFNESDRQNLLGETVLAKTFNKLLKLDAVEEDEVFKAYVQSTEVWNRSHKQFSVDALLWEFSRGTFTDDVTIKKDDENHYFFRSNFEKYWHARGLWGGSFELNDLFPFDARSVVNAKIEYEKSESQLEIPFKKFTLEDTSKLSLQFDREIYVRKTQGRMKKTYRDYAVSFVENHSREFDPLIAQKIQTGELLGPLNVAVKSIVQGEGVAFLNGLPHQVLQLAIVNYCNKSDEGEESVSIQKGLWNKHKHCLNDLGGAIWRYRDELAETGEISLWKLKNIIHNLARYSKGMEGLTPFFGEGNIFSAGRFKSATTHAEGLPYTTYTQSGNFKNFGLIDSKQHL